jgi:hypothetical protein
MKPPYIRENVPKTNVPKNFMRKQSNSAGGKCKTFLY